MNKEMETVADVLNKVQKARDYNEFFVDASGNVTINNRSYRPGDIKIIKTYRFEGDADPADEAIIYVIETYDGTIAYSLDAYGASSNQLSDDYASLIRKFTSRSAEKEITRLIRRQMLLEKKNKGLQLINNDLTNFVNTASHDLLAPLANIELSIRLIDTLSITDKELRDYINIIHLSVEKFRALINDISEVGKVEGDMLQLKAVDVAEVIDNVEWSLENTIRDQHAIINKNIQVKFLMFSRKNLRSIIYNLVSNAIKFRNGNTPVITIDVKKVPGGVNLVITDNGIGIPQAQQEKIFNLYGRINGDVEGKGIGLYLAKKIIDGIEGSIGLESELNKGSRFTIFFPDHEQPVM